MGCLSFLVMNACEFGGMNLSHYLPMHHQVFHWFHYVHAPCWNCDDLKKKKLVKISQMGVLDKVIMHQEKRMGSLAHWLRYQQEAEPNPAGPTPPLPCRYTSRRLYTIASPSHPHRSTATSLGAATEPLQLTAGAAHYLYMLPKRQLCHAITQGGQPCWLPPLLPQRTFMIGGGGVKCCHMVLQKIKTQILLFFWLFCVCLPGREKQSMTNGRLPIQSTFTHPLNAKERYGLGRQFDCVYAKFSVSPSSQQVTGHAPINR